MSLRQLFALLALSTLNLVECQAAADIVLGQVAPFSGPLAPTGSSLRAGIQLYIDATNASGGINGAKLKLVSKDDEYKTEQTVRQARQLIQEAQPVALTGIVGTGNVSALLSEHLLEDTGIPLVGVRTGASSIVGSNNPWLFLTRASYANEIEKIVEQFASTGNKRFAVFYQNDPFGQDGLSSAEKLVAQYKGEIIARASYEKNTTEVAAAVKTIVAANPQTVIMISNTAASAEFVKQMRAAGNVSQLATISTTDGPQVAAKIGPEIAKGLSITQVVPAPNAVSTPLIKEIQAAYKRFPNTETALNHTLIEGYLSAKIIGEGLRKAGPNPTGKQLREALKSLNNRDMGGVFINYSGKSQSGLNYVDITILNREGKLLR